MTTKHILKAVAVCCAVLFTACTKSPSDNEIKQAITDFMQDKSGSVTIGANRLRGSGGLKLGAEIKIESVEVKQLGKYNEVEKYWPVKAQVKGTRQADLLLLSGTSHFDEEIDFKLKLDDFGKWKASLLDQ